MGRHRLSCAKPGRDSQLRHSETDYLHFQAPLSLSSGKGAWWEFPNIWVIVRLETHPRAFSLRVVPCVAAAGTPWSFTALRKRVHREAVTTERKAETSTLWFSLLVLTSGHLWRTLKGQEIIKCDFKLEGSLWLRVKNDLGTGKPETATKVLNIWAWWNNSSLKQEKGYKFKVTRD